MVLREYDNTISPITIMVQCDFIAGSEARGCMVVLVDEFGNTTYTVNLTRSSTCTAETLTLSTLPHDVFGVDLESDGSVGTIHIPGVVSNTSLCVPSTVTPPPSGSRKLILVCSSSPACMYEVCRSITDLDGDGCWFSSSAGCNHLYNHLLQDQKVSIQTKKQGLIKMTFHSEM